MEIEKTDRLYHYQCILCTVDRVLGYIIISVYFALWTEHSSHSPTVDTETGCISICVLHCGESTLHTALLLIAAAIVCCCCISVRLSVAFVSIVFIIDKGSSIGQNRNRIMRQT